MFTIGQSKANRFSVGSNVKLAYFGPGIRAFVYLKRRRVIHQPLRLTLPCSEIRAKREILYLPRELAFAIRGYPGFRTENL